jgi:ABC-2 type transport system permease protein
MVRAELLNLASTTSAKVTALLALAGLVVTQLAFVALLPAIARGDIGGVEGAADEMGGFDLSAAASQLDALSPLGASMGGGSVGIAILAIAIFGVLAGTSDYRFGGIVGAALAAPRRWPILTAKAAASGISGLVLGTVLVLTSAAVLLVTLAVSGTPFTLDIGQAAAVLGRGAIVVTCLVLLGLAIGILTRSQLAGVLIVLTVMLSEPLVAGVTQMAAGTVPVWTQVLPVALANAAIGTGPSLLPPLVAGGILIGITAVALIAAGAVVRRRDI